MSRTKSIAHGFLLSLLLAAPACSLQKTDDVSEYRQALPKADAVRVSGPEIAPGSSALGLGDAPAETARWYHFTRDVRDGVNVVTGHVLVAVWALVHVRPSEVGDDYAQWGPYTEALEPVTYRFRVERVGENEYDYRLDGRPRASKSEDDYRAVLTGKGFGRADARHGDGSFVIDLDAAKALDPSRHQDDSGTIEITHDLPEQISTNLGALPRTIRARLDPAGEAWFDITSVAKQDFTGTLVVDAHADTDDSKATTLEDVAVHSQWNADGAGRADISVSGGDLPTTIAVLDATECWGGDFARVYYTDSVGIEPTEGEASACAYSAPSGS